MLHLPTLELGADDPLAAEPAAEQLVVVEEPQPGGVEDVVDVDEVGETTSKAALKPKILENLRQVTPSEQQEQTKSRKQKQDEEAKKIAKAKQKKQAQTAKNKQKAKKAKARKSKSKRLAKVTKAAKAAKERRVAKSKMATAAVGQERDQPDQKLARKTPEATRVRKPKRNRKQANTPEAAASAKCRDSKAKKTPTKPVTPKRKAAPKKQVDQAAVKALRSRKSSAYHKAYKAAVGQGESEEDAKKAAKAVTQID